MADGKSDPKESFLRSPQYNSFLTGTGRIVMSSVALAIFCILGSPNVVQSGNAVPWMLLYALVITPILQISLYRRFYSSIDKQFVAIHSSSTILSLMPLLDSNRISGVIMTSELSAAAVLALAFLVFSRKYLEFQKTINPKNNLPL